ncbi:MAG: hypothetical protein KME27_21920 [Lyngbya sp. HA4199-MV5]|nr:hypothetical protein [Lyngbya sp. HA4199-MV5]
MSRNSHLSAKAPVSSRVEVKLVGWKERAGQYAPQLCFSLLASRVRQDLTGTDIVSDGARAGDRDILIRFSIAAVSRCWTSAQRYACDRQRHEKKSIFIQHVALLC